MVVRSVLFVVQAIVFLAFFAVGSVLLPLLPALPVLQMSIGPGRVFVFDGLVFAFGLYVVVLLIEVVRKRVRSAGVVTTVAFLTAVLLGLLMRFGFKSL